MFNTQSMVLIADHDPYSNSSLSVGLRKLGLARTVVCTTSSSQALAYLHKQRSCSYPFPDLIFYNPNIADGESTDFLNTLSQCFMNEHCMNLFVLEDKADVSANQFSGFTDIISGKLKKPISMDDLVRVCSGEGQSIALE